jgi:predicted phage terminase large subunit-like protein
VILTSYGADLATKHSKEVRDLIASDRYSTVFGEMASTDEPVLLDSDSRSSAAWELAGHSGGMIAAGVGGAITGFGANLFIVDDPFKSREDADSEARRDNVWEWYRSVAYNRLDNTSAAIILIMTRWDQDDLAGKLLNAMVSDYEADQWTVVYMPGESDEVKDYPTTEEEYVENLLSGIYIPRAQDGDQLGRAPGEPLWREKHDEAALKKIKANIGDFEYVAQFGQKPRLAVGEFLDDDDFDIVEKAPDGLRWYWYADLALGESKTSDSNCTGGVALQKEDLYIRDVVKIRDLDSFLPELHSLMLSDEEIGSVWGIEDVAFQKLVVKDFLAKPSLVNKEVMGVKPNGDKVERARPWRRRAKTGHVHLVRGTWNRELIRIAAAFPKGRHDDEVDMISGAVQMIAEDNVGNKKTASAVAVVVDAESLFGVVIRN